MALMLSQYDKVVDGNREQDLGVFGSRIDDSNVTLVS